MFKLYLVSIITFISMQFANAQDSGSQYTDRDTDGVSVEEVQDFSLSMDLNSDVSALHRRCLPYGALCGNNNSACCSGICIKVSGSNNNYCAARGIGGGGRYGCYYDRDCRYDEVCRGGRCIYGRYNRCLPSGALCGNDNGACCSRTCVTVPGSNNNFCR